MANVAISYSHQDPAVAAQVRSAFIAHDLTVWMDEIEGDSVAAENISLPWGQAHWEVITAEFSAADVIVVIDTPNWRASRYCRDEYHYVQHYGKWVEFLPVDPTNADTAADQLTDRIAQIATALQTRRAVTSAHTRLIETARTGQQPHQSRFERLLHRAGERDARLLLSSSPATSGITITDELAHYARANLNRGAQARKRLRRMATSAIVILAVLALVGVGALFLAQAGQRAATAASARSQALELASRSGQEPNTVVALELAEQAAGQLDDNTTRSAVNIASANDRRLRTLITDRRNYFSASWAADAPIVVGYSLNNIVVTDTDSGLTRDPITVPFEIQAGTLAVSADGSSAVLANREQRQLHFVDLNTGETRETDFRGILAVATGDGAELWWATDDGALSHSSFVDVAAGGSPAQFFLPTPALAISVTADRGLLDYIGRDGSMRTLGYWDPEIPELGSIEIVAPDAVTRSFSRQSPAALKRCGDNMFGSITGTSDFKSNAFYLFNGELSVHRSLRSEQPPVCNTDGTAWTTGKVFTRTRAIVGNNRPIIPGDGSVSFIAVTDPSSTRSAVLAADGRLFVVPERRIGGASAANAAALLPMTSAEFHITEQGDIVRSGTDEVTGTVPTPFASAATLGDNGMLVSIDGLTRVDRDGRGSLAVRHPAGAQFHTLRPGADSKHFVAIVKETVLLVSADGQQNRAVSIPELEEGEQLLDADVAPDSGGVVFATTRGRIGVVSIDFGVPTEADFSATRFPGGTQTRVAYVPSTGDVAVTASDGTLRLFDRLLTPKTTTFHGEAAEAINTAGKWILLSSSVVGNTVYDGETLVIQDQITPRVGTITPRTVHLNVGAGELIGLDINDREPANTSRRTIPVFGIGP